MADPKHVKNWGQNFVKTSQTSIIITRQFINQKRESYRNIFDYELLRFFLRYDGYLKFFITNFCNKLASLKRELQFW